MIKKISIWTFCVGAWLTLIFGFLYVPLVPWFAADRSINIFIWNELITKDTIVEFEKQTGIKVNVSYFDLNEELFVKLKATGGVGYDLMTPSNFVIEAMIEQGLLKRLDHKKLTFLDKLEPRLLDLSFDPGNAYSIPFYWGSYGVAVNKKFFNGNTPTPSWNLLFKRDAITGRVIMSDDIRVTVFLAAYHLFPQQTEVLNDAQVEQVKTLLLAQKEWLEAYTENRAAYLIHAGNAPAALVVGSELWRFMIKNPDLVFLTPKEGGFLHIDSLVIPAGSTKEDLVYEFVSYLYEREPMMRRFDEFGVLPPTSAAISELAVQDGIEGRLPLPGTPDFENLRLFGPIVTNEQINEVWLALRS